MAKRKLFLFYIFSCNHKTIWLEIPLCRKNIIYLVFFLWWYHYMYKKLYLVFNVEMHRIHHHQCNVAVFLQGWSIYLIIWRRNPGPFGHEYPALALLATRCHFIIIMILSGGEDSQTLACWRPWETPLSKTLDMMWCDEFW